MAASALVADGGGGAGGVGETPLLAFAHQVSSPDPNDLAGVCKSALMDFLPVVSSSAAVVGGLIVLLLAVLLASPLVDALLLPPFAVFAVFRLLPHVVKVSHSANLQVIPLVVLSACTRLPFFTRESASVWQMGGLCHRRRLPEAAAAATRAPRLFSQQRRSFFCCNGGSFIYIRALLLPIRLPPPAVVGNMQEDRRFSSVGSSF